MKLKHTVLMAALLSSPVWANLDASLQSLAVADSANKAEAAAKIKAEKDEQLRIQKAKDDQARRDRAARQQREDAARKSQEAARAKVENERKSDKAREQSYEDRVRELELRRLEARVNRENDLIDAELGRMTSENDLIKSEADSNRTISTGVADTMRGAVEVEREKHTAETKRIEAKEREVEESKKGFWK